jgi:hypothetical protein
MIRGSTTSEALNLRSGDVIVSTQRTVAKAAVLNRSQLHAVLQSLFVNVVINWKRDQLVFNWSMGAKAVRMLR